MDKNKITEFEERYQNMHEDELVTLHKKNSLVEEAKVALGNVILDRGINLTEIMQEEQEEKDLRVKKREIIEVKEQKRDKFLLKAMLVIGIPICLFQLIFNTDKFYQTFVSTIVSAVGIGIVSAIVYAFKRGKKTSKTPN